MTLACEFEGAPSSLEPMQIALMVFSLVAPLVVFLVLPKRLSLRYELRLALAGALRPLAWLASRAGGNREEAAAWGPRLRRAARDLSERAHPAGPAAEVIRDPHLLARAHAVGWVAASIPTLGATAVAAMFLANTYNPSLLGLKYAVAALVPVVAASWLAWVGGVAGAIQAQALALGGGRHGGGGFARALSAGIVGVGYGAFTGFFAAMVSMALFAPVMSLLTGDPPPLRDLYLLFGGYGVVAAAVGATCGALALVPMALSVNRQSVRL